MRYMQPMPWPAIRHALSRSPLPPKSVAAALDGCALEMLEQRPHGQLQEWRQALQSLPPMTVEQLDLDSDSIQLRGRCADEHGLMAGLQRLSPWRKGPFRIGEVSVDSEWRSNMKWDRVRTAVSDWEGQRVLDVGSGNGYYCLRALGAGAACAIGIDPSPLSVIQFEVIKRYAPSLPSWVLPLRSDELPSELGCFDRVMSMGVLYHRPSPFDHLRQLRRALRPGGQLLLETLVTDGPLHHALVPEDRYAGMRNVYFLPSVPTLEHWTRRAGFVDVATVNVTSTTVDEQRATAWMTGHSLPDFLSPDNPARTIEGLPAPRRALVVAQKP